MGFFSDVWGGFKKTVLPIATLGLMGGGGSSAGAAEAQASLLGAGTAAKSQSEALDYLKEVEAVPRQFREGALTRLAGMYGLEGGEGAPLAGQEQLIEQARMSPLYSAIMGTQEAGEDAILRQAGATGGLRSGNVQQALATNAQQLENEALLTSYNQQLQEQGQEISGLGGLANLQSYAPQIAQQTSNIGMTMAQGITGAAQARTAAQNQQMNQLMGLGQLGLGAVAAFSDIRLKEDIKQIGFVGPHKWYEWDWNEEAEALGLEGKGQGVMAHEVYEESPEIIGECDGYITVDYGVLYGE